MIREFLQRRAARKAFSRYVTREAMDAALAGRFEDPGLRSGEIGYVLAWVRGDSPERVSDRMGRVAELATEYGGVTDCMVSGLVVVCFGALPVSAPQRDGRAGLVVALIREFGKDVKLVHGSCAGYFGNLGSPNRMTYSFISPEFEPALARLCAMEFGLMEEFDSRKKSG